MNIAAFSVNANIQGFGSLIQGGKGIRGPEDETNDWHLSQSIPLRISLAPTAAHTAPLKLKLIVADDDMEQRHRSVTKPVPKLAETGGHSTPSCSVGLSTCSANDELSPGWLQPQIMYQTLDRLRQQSGTR